MTERNKCPDCNYRYPVGKSPRCNPCRKKRARDRKHDTHLRKTYGITIEDYYSMWILQGKSCAICDGGTSRRYLACDHDHKTGEVRGLLCARCNKVLASVRDNTATLHKAITYLDTPPARSVLGERDWSGYAD